MTPEQIRKEADEIVSRWFGNEPKALFVKHITDFASKIFNAGVEKAATLIYEGTEPSTDYQLANKIRSLKLPEGEKK